MILLFLLVVPGIIGGTLPMRKYFTTQKNLVILDHNDGLIQLVTANDVWPSFINYTQDITDKTGIDIIVGFAECNDSHEFNHIIIKSMDICDILSNSVGMPPIPQTKFMIPEMLGLFGTECPIKAGLRNINPYRFPTVIEMEDIGTGIREFIIKIDDRNKSLPIITLATTLDMKYWNDKYLLTESSSSILTPSIMALSVVFIIEKFIL
ncbi:uncharacterized protein [Chelonus insularis]|uniref:uncharacterized protein n=1 Tax=Chelonus insularis TaxID=460826 RepID=UPI001589303F|nr:uncharacterized protein LOC118074676 [Chelonus insularis]